MEEPKKYKRVQVYDYVLGKGRVVDTRVERDLIVVSMIDQGSNGLIIELNRETEI